MDEVKSYFWKFFSAESQKIVFTFPYEFPHTYKRYHHQHIVVF